MIDQAIQLEVSRMLKKPKRFEHFWLRDPTVVDVVRTAWALSIQGSAAYVLVQKVKEVRKALREWNIKTRSFISQARPDQVTYSR